MQAAQLLVNRGASIVARDNMRRTAYDASSNLALRQWLLPLQMRAEAEEPSHGGRGAAAATDRRAADGGHAGLRRAADERGERERPVRGPGLLRGAADAAGRAAPAGRRGRAAHGCCAAYGRRAAAASGLATAARARSSAYGRRRAAATHARRAAAAAVAAEARVGAAAPARRP